MAGKRWKLYRNTGTHDVPVWAEIKRARDVKVPRGKGEADGSRREGAFEIAESALKTISLEFGYVYKPGTDADFTALLDSYESNTPIQFAVVDGDIATEGTRGVKLWGEVFQFDVDAPLKGDNLIPAVVRNVSEDDNGDFHEPEWFTVPGA